TAIELGLLIHLPIDKIMRWPLARFNLYLAYFDAENRKAEESEKLAEARSKISSPRLKNAMASMGHPHGIS
ncbi:hypothetical protein LCGC14_1966730, partial [marine sediment metagenome]